MGVDVFIPSAHSQSGQNIDPAVGFDKSVIVRDPVLFFCRFFFEIIGAHIPLRIKSFFLGELGLRVEKLFEYLIAGFHLTKINIIIREIKCVGYPAAKIL